MANSSRGLNRTIVSLILFRVRMPMQDDFCVRTNVNYVLFNLFIKNFRVISKLSTFLMCKSRQEVCKCIFDESVP